ncbi:hypothetical protein [Nocardia gipuzkoensis]
MQDDDPVGDTGTGTRDLDETHPASGDQRQDMLRDKIIGRPPLITCLCHQYQQVRQIIEQLRGPESGIEQSAGSAVQGFDRNVMTSGSVDIVQGEGLPNSTFMRELHDGGIAVPGIAYTQIVTRYDEVLPYTAGMIEEPGVANYILQDMCAQDYADHLSINSDPVTARLVLNALDPEHPQPVECTLVLPAIGVPPTSPGR